MPVPQSLFVGFEVTKTWSNELPGTPYHSVRWSSSWVKTRRKPPGFDRLSVGTDRNASTYPTPLGRAESASSGEYLRPYSAHANAPHGRHRSSSLHGRLATSSQFSSKPGASSKRTATGSSWARQASNSNRNAMLANPPPPLPHQGHVIVVIFRVPLHLSTAQPPQPGSLAQPNGE